MFEALADWLVVDLGGLSREAGAGAALHFFVMDVTKIFTLLVAIIYIMGLLRALVSPERVRDFVRGRPRWLSRGLAIALGAVTPFCSCSSVPLFVGFVEAGIPIGVTFSFLIASPMVNEVAVVVLASILGWQLTASYVGVGLAVAWVGGTLMDWLHADRWVEDYVRKLHVGDGGAPEAPPQDFAARHAFAWGEVREIVGRVWKWVLIGVAAGALFHGFVPDAWVAAHLGRDSGVFSVPLAVGLGVPLYSNATGVIPVAEALLGKGVPLGTVLALMMSISALSLPEMLILRKVVRWQGLAVFAGILAVAFTLVGWGFNLLG